MPQHDPELLRWCRDELKLPVAVDQRTLSNGVAAAHIVVRLAQRLNLPSALLPGDAHPTTSSTSPAPPTTQSHPQGSADAFLSRMSDEDTTAAKVRNFLALKPALQRLGVRGVGHKLLDEVGTEQRGAGLRLLLCLKLRWDEHRGGPGGAGGPSGDAEVEAMARMTAAATAVRSVVGAGTRDRRAAEEAAKPYVTRLLERGLTRGAVALEVHTRKFQDFMVAAEAEAAAAEAVEGSQRFAATRSLAEATIRREGERKAWLAQSQEAEEALHSAELARRSDREKIDLAYELTALERQRIEAHNALVLARQGALGPDGVEGQEARMRRMGIDPQTSSVEKAFGASSSSSSSSSSGGGAGSAQLLPTRREVVGAVSAHSIPSLAPKSTGDAASAVLAAALPRLDAATRAGALAKLEATGGAAPLHGDLASSLRSLATTSSSLPPQARRGRARLGFSGGSGDEGGGDGSDEEGLGGQGGAGDGPQDFMERVTASFAASFKPREAALYGKAAKARAAEARNVRRDKGTRTRISAAVAAEHAATAERAAREEEAVARYRETARAERLAAEAVAASKAAKAARLAEGVEWARRTEEKLEVRFAERAARDRAAAEAERAAKQAAAAPALAAKARSREEARAASHAAASLIVRESVTDLLVDLSLAVVDGLEEVRVMGSGEGGAAGGGAAAEGSAARLFPSEWRALRRSFVDGSIAAPRRARAKEELREAAKAEGRPHDVPGLPGAPNGLAPWGLLLGDRVAGTDRRVGLTAEEAAAALRPASPDADGAVGRRQQLLLRNARLPEPLRAGDATPFTLSVDDEGDVRVAHLDSADLADWTAGAGAWALPRAGGGGAGAPGGAGGGAGHGGGSLSPARSRRSSRASGGGVSPQSSEVLRAEPPAGAQSSSSSSSSPPSSPRGPHGGAAAPTWALKAPVQAEGLQALAAALFRNEADMASEGFVGPALLLAEPATVLLAPASATASPSSATAEAAAASPAQMVQASHAQSLLASRLAARTRMLHVQPMDVILSAVAHFDADNASLRSQAAALGAAGAAAAASLPTVATGETGSIRAAMRAWRQAGGEADAASLATRPAAATTKLLSSSFSYGTEEEEHEAAAVWYELGAHVALSQGALHKALGALAPSSSAPGALSPAAVPAALSSSSSSSSSSHSPAVNTEAGLRGVSASQLLAALHDSSADAEAAVHSVVHARAAILAAASGHPEPSPAAALSASAASRSRPGSRKEDAKAAPAAPHAAPQAATAVKGGRAGSASAHRDSAAAVAAPAPAPAPESTGDSFFAVYHIRHTAVFAKALALYLAQVLRAVARARESAAENSDPPAGSAGPILPGFGGLLLDGCPSSPAELVAVEYALGGSLVWGGSSSDGGAEHAAAHADHEHAVLPPHTAPSSSPSALVPVGRNPSPLMPAGWDLTLGSLLHALEAGAWALPAVGAAAQSAWQVAVAAADLARKEAAEAEAAAAAKAAADAEEAVAAAPAALAAKGKAGSTPSSAGARPPSAHSAAGDKKQPAGKSGSAGSHHAAGGASDASAAAALPPVRAGPGPQPPASSCVDVVLVLDAAFLASLVFSPSGASASGPVALALDAFTGVPIPLASYPATAVSPLHELLEHEAAAAAEAAAAVAAAAASTSRPGTSVGGSKVHAAPSAAASGKPAGKGAKGAAVVEEPGASDAVDRTRVGLVAVCADEQAVAALSVTLQASAALVAGWNALAPRACTLRAGAAAASEGEERAAAGASSLTVRRLAGILEVQLEHALAAAQGGKRAGVDSHGAHAHGAGRHAAAAAVTVRPLLVAAARGVLPDTGALVAALRAFDTCAASHKDLVAHVLRALRALQSNARVHSRRVARAVLRLLRGIPDSAIPPEFGPAQQPVRRTVSEIERGILATRSRVLEEHALRARLSVARPAQHQPKGGARGDSESKVATLTGRDRSRSGSGSGELDASSSSLLGVALLPKPGASRRTDPSTVVLTESGVSNAALLQLADDVASLEVNEQGQDASAVERICAAASEAGALVWRSAEGVRDSANRLISALRRDGWREDVATSMHALAALLVHADLRAAEDGSAFAAAARYSLSSDVERGYEGLMGAAHVEVALANPLGSCPGVQAWSPAPAPLNSSSFPSAAAADASCGVSAAASLPSFAVPSHVEHHAFAGPQRTPRSGAGGPGGGLPAHGGAAFGQMASWAASELASLLRDVASAPGGARAAESAAAAATASWSRILRTCATIAAASSSLVRAHDESLEWAQGAVAAWSQARNASVMRTVKSLQTVLRANADPEAWRVAVANADRASRLAGGPGGVMDPVAAAAALTLSAPLPVPQSSSVAAAQSSTSGVPRGAGRAAVAANRRANSTALAAGGGGGGGGGSSSFAASPDLGGTILAADVPLPRLSALSFVVPAADGITEVYGFLEGSEQESACVLWDGGHVAGAVARTIDSAAAAGHGGTFRAGVPALVPPTLQIAKDVADLALRELTAAGSHKRLHPSSTASVAPLRFDSLGKKIGLEPGASSSATSATATLEPAHALAVALGLPEGLAPHQRITGRGIQALAAALKEHADSQTEEAHAAASRGSSRDGRGRGGTGAGSRSPRGGRSKTPSRQQSRQHPQQQQQQSQDRQQHGLSPELLWRGSSSARDSSSTILDSLEDDGSGLVSAARSLRDMVRAAAEELEAGVGGSAGSGIRGRATRGSLGVPSTTSPNRSQQENQSAKDIPPAWLQAPAGVWLHLARSFASAPSGEGGGGSRMMCWDMPAARRLVLTLILARTRALPTLDQLVLQRRNLALADVDGDGLLTKKELRGACLWYETLPARAAALVREQDRATAAVLLSRIATPEEEASGAGPAGALDLRRRLRVAHLVLGGRVAPEAAAAQGGEREADEALRHTLVATSAAARLADADSLREALWSLYSVIPASPSAAALVRASDGAGSVSMMSFGLGGGSSSRAARTAEDDGDDDDGARLDSLALALDLCSDPASFMAAAPRGSGSAEAGPSSEWQGQQHASHAAALLNAMLPASVGSPLFASAAAAGCVISAASVWPGAPFLQLHGATSASGAAGSLPGGRSEASFARRRSSGGGGMGPGVGGIGSSASEDWGTGAGGQLSSVHGEEASSSSSSSSATHLAAPRLPGLVKAWLVAADAEAAAAAGDAAPRLPTARELAQGVRAAAGDVAAIQRALDLLAGSGVHAGDKAGAVRIPAASAESVLEQGGVAAPPFLEIALEQERDVSLDEVLAALAASGGGRSGAAAGGEECRDHTVVARAPFGLPMCPCEAVSAL